MIDFLATILVAAAGPLDHVIIKEWEWSPQLLGGHLLSNHNIMLLFSGVLLVTIALSLSGGRAMVPRGRSYNLLEVYVVFMRDFIARPALHDKAYRFLPLLLTLFGFILFNNLLGIVPLLDISHALGLDDSPIGGAATGNIWVNGGLALMVFAVVIGAGIKTQVEHFVDRGKPRVLGWIFGFFLYLWSLVPSMPLPIKIAMAPLLIALEFVGVLIKCGVLAIRLFANMLAGHILLAVLFGFIIGAGSLIWLVAPASIVGSVALSLLELFVAFLQAYIFTFLAALFIGMAADPHH
jgi:F-type H+-transporting ATPase subunit a